MPELTSPTTKTPASTTYALLIGVNEYKNLVGSDLKGSRTDVVLLAWYCLTVLRLPIANIRMLTSPIFTDDELKEFLDAIQPEEVDIGLEDLRKACGEASKNDVSTGLDWLLEKTKGGDKALFAFSGHGSWSKKLGPVLCLGDTKVNTSGELDGVLPLRELKHCIKHGCPLSENSSACAAKEPYMIICDHM